MNQLPFPQFLPKSDWKAPTHFPDLSPAKMIGIDVETYDPDITERGPGGVRRKGFITGYAVSVDGWKGYYPVRHSGGNVPFEPVQRWLQDQLGRGHQPKVTAKGSYDREWLVTDGIHVAGIVYDIQIAECLLNEEQDSYTLDDIAFRHLGERKREEMLDEAAHWYKDKDKAKKIMHLLHAMHVGPYAENDPDITLRTFSVQEKLLKSQNLWNIFTMESELSMVVHLMRQQGVRIDLDGCEKLRKKYKSQEEEIYFNLQRKFFKGRDLNLNSADDLAIVCESQSYFDYPRTAKTGKPSFVGDWMDLQDSKTPIGEFFQGVSEYRTVEKLRRDFVEGSFTQSAYKGRIHAEFKQMRTEEGGTRSGRFACANPNLQQVPKRSKFAKEIRTLFLPDLTHEWVKLDYSQQEYRIFVSLAMTMGLPGAMEAGQTYIDNPEADFHQAIADMTGLPRDDAKNWNFAAIYGAGVDKTAKMTKKTLEEAIKVNGQYHEKVPYAKQLAEDASNRASTRGWIKTIGGRILHFETYEPDIYLEPMEFNTCKKKWPKEKIIKRKNGYVPFFVPMAIDAAYLRWPNLKLRRGQTHKSLNRYVQGSAADMTKIAMLLIYKLYGWVPLMQVHDELSYNGDQTRALLIKAQMENAVKIKVPVVADCSMGPNWGTQVKVTLK